VDAASRDGYRCLLPEGHVGHPLDLYTAPRPARDERPWVTGNFVAGVDGAVAVAGRVGPLTSPADQHVFHLLRSVADLILVGAGTVRAERYGPAHPTAAQRAERRARGQAEVPPIAIVSASLQFDYTLPVFADAEVRPIVVTSATPDRETARDRARPHAEVLAAGDPDVDFPTILGELHDRGVRHVLCEGGPTLIGTLLAVGLLDELCLTVAPLAGGDPLRLVAGIRPPLTRFSLASVVAHDDELFLRYLAAAGVAGR
jgi:riboflavin biosynthesis pyrimidine reductase